MKGELVRKPDGTAEWVAPNPVDSFPIPTFFTTFPYFWKDWTEDERLYESPLDEFIRSPSLVPDHEIIWHWEGASVKGKPNEVWKEKTILIDLARDPNRDLKRTRHQNESRIDALMGRDYVNDDQVRDATVNLHASILEQEIERTHAILTSGLVPNPKDRTKKVPISPDERNKLENSMLAAIRLYHELTGSLKKGGGGNNTQVNVIVSALDALMQHHAQPNAETASAKPLPEAAVLRNAIIDVLDAEQKETADVDDDY